MSDKYVVTEDEWIRINNCLPDMAKQILERPLSTILTKDREKMFKKLERSKHLIWQSPQSYGQITVVSWDAIKSIFKR